MQVNYGVVQVVLSHFPLPLTVGFKCCSRTKVSKGLLLVFISGEYCSFKEGTDTFFSS